VLKYKIFYNIDKNALENLLNQPAFKNEELKEKLLEIYNNVNIEYENFKRELEKNPNDDYFRFYFGFYEISENKHYKE